MGNMPTPRAIQAISIILGLPEQSVKTSLAADSTLAKSGLLRLDPCANYLLENKFSLLSEGFADAMLNVDGDAMALLGQSVRPAAPPTLSPADYSHLGEAYPMLEAYLRSVLGRKRAGVNILLYGPPGTGKSELARLLARQTGTPLMEVVCDDSDGDPISGEKRLSAYRAAQWIFARSPALILFDEIEDVFNDASPFGGHRSFGQSRKGWINAMLEQNPVPSLWISNAVACLDDAFIRRFDLVIEVPAPSKARRKEMLTQAGMGVLDDRTAAQLCETEHVTPAIISRAADVTRAINREAGTLEPGVVMTRLIDGTLKAQGFAITRASHAKALPEIYDPAFVNADVDVARLADGLKASGSGRICLYGPREPARRPMAAGWPSGWTSPCSSGAGRISSPCMWAARRSYRPGLRRGEERAGRADDRRGRQLPAGPSRRPSQLGGDPGQRAVDADGRYDGIFIASTNLMDGIDQAALRRFDVKARFDYLSHEQACALLRQHCRAGHFPATSSRDERSLLDLERLNAGRFRGRRAPSAPHAAQRRICLGRSPRRGVRDQGRCPHEDRLSLGGSLTMPTPPRALSKSKLMACRQCEKRLWLEVHKPELREDSAESLAAFATGHGVGEVARTLYDPKGDGELIDVNSLGISGALQRTAEVSEAAQTRLRSRFSVNGALAFADILLPSSSGRPAGCG